MCSLVSLLDSNQPGRHTDQDLTIPNEHKSGPELFTLPKNIDPNPGTEAQNMILQNMALPHTRCSELRRSVLRNGLKSKSSL